MGLKNQSKQIKWKEKKFNAVVVVAFVWWQNENESPEKKLF